MNERKVLILHYSSKKEQWYDATNVIFWYALNDNCVNVKFSNIDNFTYVSYDNIRIYENPKSIDFTELYYRDYPCFNVRELIKFDNRIYKIFYKNGITTFAFPKDIKIFNNKADLSKSKNVLSYYQRVVQDIAENKEDSFLCSQFDNIQSIDEQSVLHAYLNKRLYKSKLFKKNIIISPFGTNLSQTRALEKMMNNNISVIEGPPGTGKTQTILNFISNALINNLTIAVASNNNSATKNIYSKLEKYGYSFLVAQLGNNDNVNKFFEEYDSSVPLFAKKKIDEKRLTELSYVIREYYDIENQIKKLNENKDEFIKEYEHFISDYSELNLKDVVVKKSRVTSSDILKFIIKSRELDKKLNIWDKFTLRFKYKLNKDIDINNKDILILYLYNLFFRFKIKEIDDEIKTLNTKIFNKKYEDLVKEYTELSKTYLENYFSDKFNILQIETSENFDKTNYKKDFSSFVERFPVILSSTYSLAKCSKNDYLFDYLIVDESSQVSMASAIIAMRMAKNIIIVGDTKQLPQIDNPNFEKRNKELLIKFNVDPAYSYYGNNLMSSFLKLYPEVPKVMLKEHYRCNPNIIGFCNKRFYNNELVIYSKNSNPDYSMKLIKTNPGNFARKNPNDTGWYNQREIDEIKKLIENEKLEDIGVITPYRYQAECINKTFGDLLEASTIHKFQGREKKTIIFSSVVNEPNDFVEDENIINVAVSRAVNKFIFITSDKIEKSKSGVLSDLVNYIKYNDSFSVVEKSNIKSIYDLLYDDYEKLLNEFRKKYPSKDFDSENLTKALLLNILNDKMYSSLNFKMHVSLKDFLYFEKGTLTYDEFKFYNNRNSHADFLIYNSMNKKPLLVIEVDGVSYHEKNKTQLERDSKKDAIISKANLSILRLKTNESGEKEKIIAELNKILSN